MCNITRYNNGNLAHPAVYNKNIIVKSSETSRNWGRVEKQQCIMGHAFVTHTQCLLFLIITLSRSPISGSSVVLGVSFLSGVPKLLSGEPRVSGDMTEIGTRRICSNRCTTGSMSQSLLQTETSAKYDYTSLVFLRHCLFVCERMHACAHMCMYHS